MDNYNETVEKYEKRKVYVILMDNQIYGVYKNLADARTSLHTTWYDEHEKKITEFEYFGWLAWHNVQVEKTTLN